MNKNLPSLNACTASTGSGFAKKFTGVLMLFLLLGVSTTFASHFRHGNISWRVVSGRTIEFKITQAWRYTAFYPTLGGTVSNIDYMNFGDGTGSYFNLKVTSVNTTEDWFYGEATVTRTYNSDGAFTAFFSSCCKIGNLANNANGDWRVETVVTVGNNNNSPVSTLPALVNLPFNQAAASFAVPVADPDGDALSFRLATYNEMLGSNPSGFSVNATTGLATFNTVGKSVGQLYNAAIVITDSKGAKSIIDFIIKITQQSTPPAFDYAVTPVNGTVFQVSPGQSVNFNIKASDSDAGDNVLLQAVGVPPGASFTPGLPLQANPAQTSFSWTPSTSNLGTNVINFIAQDNQGVQRNSSVTILVSMKPIFNVPPTPAAGTYTFVTPGQAIAQLVQASDPDTTDKVEILSASGIAGASIIPSALANPTSTILSWTPQASQWGVNTITLVAKDTYGDKTNHSFNYVVNSAPKFTSSQSNVSIVAGQQFSYNITVSDSDLAYGDTVEINTGHHTPNALPAWLTLTDNGDGTATLSGTPQVSDAGTFTVSLVAEDIYHHNGGTDHQSFDVTVVPCNTKLSASVTNVSCPVGNDGAIDLIVNGGTAPFTFAWSNGSTSEDLSNVAPGTYSVVVTDKNACTEMLSIDVLATPDTTAPTAVAQNISVTLVNGAASITSSSIDNGSTDACGIQSITISKSNFDCSNAGNNLVILTVTDNSGNVSTDTAIVNVIGATPATSIAVSRTNNTFTGLDSQTIALGYGAQSVTLTASNSTSAGDATSYTWSPAAGLSNTATANPVFTPTSAGSYTFTVTATNEFGCSSSSSVTITVIDVRSGNKGDKVLVCHKAGNNKWVTISIGASAVATHLANGGYLGACRSSASVASASISELSLANSLSVSNSLSAYPNPVAGQTTVTFNLAAEQANVSLDLYNLTGAKVKNVYAGSAKATQEYTFSVDASSIPAGVYFLKLNGNKLALSFKVIVIQ